MVADANNKKEITLKELCIKHVNNVVIQKSSSVEQKKNEAQQENAKPLTSAVEGLIQRLYGSISKNIQDKLKPSLFTQILDKKKPQAADSQETDSKLISNVKRPIFGFFGDLTKWFDNQRNTFKNKISSNTDTVRQQSLSPNDNLASNSKKQNEETTKTKSGFKSNISDWLKDLVKVKGEPVSDFDKTLVGIGKAKNFVGNLFKRDKTSKIETTNEPSTSKEDIVKPEVKQTNNINFSSKTKSGFKSNISDWLKDLVKVKGEPVSDFDKTLVGIGKAKNFVGNLFKRDKTKKTEDVNPTTESKENNTKPQTDDRGPSSKSKLSFGSLLKDWFKPSTDRIKPESNSEPKNNKGFLEGLKSIFSSFKKEKPETKQPTEDRSFFKPESDKGRNLQKVVIENFSEKALKQLPSIIRSSSTDVLIRELKDLRKEVSRELTKLRHSVESISTGGGSPDSFLDDVDDPRNKDKNKNKNKNRRNNRRRGSRRSPRRGPKPKFNAKGAKGLGRTLSRFARGGLGRAGSLLGKVGSVVGLGGGGGGLATAGITSAQLLGAVAAGGEIGTRIGEQFLDKQDKETFREASGGYGGLIGTYKAYQTLSKTNEQTAEREKENASLQADNNAKMNALGFKDTDEYNKFLKKHSKYIKEHGGIIKAGGKDAIEKADVPNVTTSQQSYPNNTTSPAPTVPPVISTPTTPSIAPTTPLVPPAAPTPTTPPTASATNVTPAPTTPSVKPADQAPVINNTSSAPDKELLREIGKLNTSFEKNSDSFSKLATGFNSLADALVQFASKQQGGGSTAVYQGGSQQQSRETEARSSDFASVGDTTISAFRTSVNQIKASLLPP